MKLGEESKENVPHKKCRVIAKKYEEENNKLSKKIDKLRVEIGQIKWVVNCKNK